jgi:hypothetical protein
VVSDSGAVEYVNDQYHVAGSYEDGVALAANAGLGREKGRRMGRERGGNGKVRLWKIDLDLRPSMFVCFCFSSSRSECSYRLPNARDFH